jgi:glycosyltransferase involved in cell wall biosynthesis/GT2 family glycosyltransferase
MRVALIINKFGIGGAERLALDQVHELRKRGMTVDVITLRGETPQLPGSRTVSFRWLHDPVAWALLVRTLRSGRYDVLLTHLWFANTVGRIAGTLAGVKRIISFEHNVYDNVKTWKQFVIDRVLQCWCTAVIAVSSAVRGSLIAHGISAYRIAVVPNGVDLSRFETPVRRSGDGSRFLFAGRILEQKGLDVLLDALAKIPGATLDVAGEGPLRAALERQAKELGIQDRVHFLGARDDVPELLSATDCFVFPSRWEGFGLSLLEAMAAGVPCIASDLPPVRGIVNDGEDALLVPPGDHEALATAMRRIMTDAPLRQRLSHGGMQDAERFSITLHVDRLLPLIERGSLIPYVSSRIHAAEGTPAHIELASIIVNWNNYERTRAFIASFARSHFPGHEVIVVDNDSPNGSTARIQKEFPQCTYVYNDRNAGIAAANNVAMRYALSRGARYVFLFNNDLEIVEDDFFEKMVAYLEAHPKAGMAAPSLMYPDGRPQNSVKRIPTPLNQIGEWLNLRWLRAPAFDRMRGGIVPREYFIAASALIVRRGVIERVGYEDERFVLGHEDVDWCLRARKAGYELHFVPGTTITHWHGVSSKHTMSNWDFYYGERMRFLMKHHSFLSVYAFRSAASFGSVTRAFVGFVRGHEYAVEYLRLALRIWRYPWRRRAYLTPFALTQRI